MQETRTRSFYHALSILPCVHSESRQQWAVYSRERLDVVNNAGLHRRCGIYLWIYWAQDLFPATTPHLPRTITAVRP